MTPFRIVQISDLHMSREYPLFHLNWRIFSELIRERAPDLVLVTGDLAINDPDRAADLAFAREQLDLLGLPYKAVPGNHDVGEAPYGVERRQSPKQPPVSDARLARFTELFGADFWLHETPACRVLGLNSQLFNTGLAREAAQFAFIEDQLRDAQGLPVIVAMHKPLYTPAFGADEPGWSIPAEQSRELVGLFTRGGVRLVVSGHLHRHKRYTEHGLDQLWAPSTAFISTSEKIVKRGGLASVGFLELAVTDDGVESTFIDDDRIINHDVRNWWRAESKPMNWILSTPSPFKAA